MNALGPPHPPGSGFHGPRRASWQRNLSPRLERAALRFCNHVRGQLGRPPVTCLQTGMPQDMIDSCVQRTIGADISTELYDDELWLLEPFRRIPLSRSVQRFNRAFDLGLYPHLCDWELIGELLARDTTRGPFTADVELRLTEQDIARWLSQLNNLPQADHPHEP